MKTCAQKMITRSFLTYSRTRVSIDLDTELQSDRELQQFEALTQLHTKFFILNDHFHNKTLNDRIPLFILKNTLKRLVMLDFKRNRLLSESYFV
jgi:hypothetical protein